MIVDRFRSRVTLCVTGVALGLVSATLPAQTPRPPAQTQRTPALAAPVAGDAADADARRAAAARLLSASRFREREAVWLKDALRSARAEMADECLTRAAAGRDMKACETIASPTPAFKTRITTLESSMLDEIIAASQTIYARHFTVAEMNEITRFFRTPVGQRYSAAYPQILNEVQGRRRVILRRYLIAAASAERKTP